VEVSVLQLTRIILGGVVITAVFLFTSGQKTTASVMENPNSTISDGNDLSDYYGFGKMEVIKLNRGINNLRIADFNGDGRDDIAVVNNPKARIELLLQKESFGPAQSEFVVDPEDEDINAIEPATRFEKETLAVSQKIHSLVCGDLNSDGLIDLAFYGEPKGLYVILQKARESQAEESKTISWRSRKKIAIDDGLTNPGSLVCADLNNDGMADLALAGRDVIYFVAQKEDKTLAEPEKYPAMAQTYAVRVADLNADNINDLVLITNDAEKPLHVRFGFPTGKLGPQMRFFIEKPHALRLYDLDGLGGDEVLAINAVGGRLSCYDFSPQKGDDQDWPILFYPLPSGEGATKRDLVVGDFDGDQLDDVVITDPAAAEIMLYRQTRGLGLAEPVRFGAFLDTVSASTADINGDGKGEIATLSIKETVIGISEFKGQRLTFPKPLEIIGDPVAMELSDVDGDGNIDCLYISTDANEVRSLRMVSYMPDAGSVDEQNIFTGWCQEDMDIELKKLKSNPDGMKLLDADQDGLLDVLVFVMYEQPMLIRQVEKGKFEVVDSPKSQSSLISKASMSSTAVADVDGKTGAELLLAQKNFTRSLIFNEGKSWNVIDQYNATSTENKISAVAAFDLDSDPKDKKPELLLLDNQKGQLQILKADENNTYPLLVQLDIGKWGAATHLKMLFAPLTGSDASSILLFDGAKFALITPPSKNETAYHFEPRFSYETKIKDGAYGNLIAGDINNDNRFDIIMTEFKQQHIEILALDPQYKPIPAMRFKVFERKSYRKQDGARGKFSIEPREMKLADVTGDKKSDLVTLIHDRIIIYPQD
jgi:hypothetical protein